MYPRRSPPVRTSPAIAAMIAGEDFENMPFRGSAGELLSPAPPPPPGRDEPVGLPPPPWATEPKPPPPRETPQPETDALDAAKIAEGTYDPPPPPIFSEDPPPVPQEPFVVEKADWRQEEVAAARRDRLQAEQAERAAELAALARLQAQLKEEKL